MAIDRLSDFKLGMGVVIKADREGLRGVGLPVVAMHSQLPRFLVVFIVVGLLFFFSDVLVLMSRFLLAFLFCSFVMFVMRRNFDDLMNLLTHGAVIGKEFLPGSYRIKRASDCSDN